MARKILLCAMPFCLGLILFANIAFCAEIFKPAFRTIGIFTLEPDLRLDINLWYPTNRAPRDLNFAPWIFSAAPSAPPAQGEFPLLVLSHATGGNRFSYHDTASWLATQGFVVAVPTHPHDSMNNMDDLFSWKQLTGRLEDINATINYVLNDKDIAKSIAPGRIGLLGYGAGGTAALLLGGAVADCSSWAGWCEGAEESTPYCMGQVRNKIDKMCSSCPMDKIAADTRIKAMVVVSPGYGMLFGKSSFAKFSPNILIVGEGRDTFNSSSRNSEHIARFLGARAHYLELPEADPGAMMAQCPAGLARELPELCLSVSGDTRNKIHRLFNKTIKTFFDKYL